LQPGLHQRHCSIKAMRMRIISDPEIVIVIAQTGGLRAAAERLDFAQSNVSRRLSALEARLGVRLFARTKKGIAPTDAGRAYIGEAEQGLASIASGERAAQALLNRPTGKLRITAPLAFGRRIIAPKVAAFAALHPEVKLDLSFSDARLDLASGEFDLGIRLGPIAEISAVTRLYRKSNLTLVASPAYLTSHNAIHSVSDLMDHACIVMSQSRVHRSWPLQSHEGNITRIEVTPTHVANDVETILYLARAGLGVTLLPDWLVEDDLESGALVRVLAGHVGTSYDAHIVLPAGSAVSAKSRGFISFLTGRSKL
jgi:DNA-binding transcriptional LysR family regulator